MRKKLLFVLGLIVLLGGSGLAFAWWDNLDETQSESILLGEGVRISVSEGTADEDKLLVPAGSFYATFTDDYTTVYSFSYTVSMENPLESGYEAALTISVNNWNITTPALDVIDYTIDADSQTSSNENLTLSSAFSDQGESYTVQVSITLANAPSAEDQQAVYDALQAEGLMFDVNFEVTDPQLSD